VETQQSKTRHWLAETKFHPPLLREDIIPRQQMLDDLQSVLISQPLTLLSAPAGYGKTTLLAALHSTCPDLSLAWLLLDEDDNDPVRFLTAFIIALQHLNPLCGTTTLSLLTGIPNPGAEVQRVTSVLINDVLDTLPNPFTLILDDLHLINEPAIFVGLNYLLDHIPPQMHLVMSSRHDPPLALARLRARGRVTELRLAKLRFTDEEALAFLNDRLSLDLSPAEVGFLQSRTEGWAVGLRLLAGSLVHLTSPEDRRTFIQDLAQTDRHIFDFLAEEVFNYQEPAVRDFLLKTSILPELTTELCQAVTELTGAGAMLEFLYRRNLFLEMKGIQGKRQPALPLTLQLPDSTPPQASYRYHDLFAEFLRHKLQQECPQLVPELHLRAARAQTDQSQAVGHYLAASRWSRAAEIIEQIGAEMFKMGYLDTLSRWINALPASVREGHPRLLHYLSNCAFWKGSWSEVQSLLEQALRGFEAAGDEAGQGEVLANLATCAMFQTDLEQGAVLFDQALGFPIPPHIRVQSLLGRATLKMEWGNWEQAEQDFNAAMALIQQTGDLDLLHLVSLPYFDPGFAFLPGGLEHMERIYRQARALVGNDVSPMRLVVEEMSTVLHLFRGQLREVIRSGESALALRERLGGHPFLGIESDLYLIIAHSVRGNYSAVNPRLDTLLQKVELKNYPTADLADLLFEVGRIHWLQGHLKEAREVYNQMCAIEDPRLEFPAARICHAWMLSLLEIADGHYEEAERILRQPEVLEQKDRRSTMGGNTRLMIARLYLEQNRHQEALAELAPVLAYHEQLGIPFTILLEGQSIVPLLRLADEEGVHETYAAYLLKLLGANDEPQPVFIAHTGETLSPREVEVLRLVVAGYSNQSIGEQLFISLWTVKSHLTHIYRKIEVASRTQAIARAHDLGLG
jgi:LuxR family transcriptional regulator, maltose regulon positive regulatory protein